MPVNQGEPIAQAIREHQVGLSDWSYARLARELHRWVEIFDQEFKLNIPLPVIKFARLRNAYATYEWLRGELGTRDNITFNSNELGRDPALILRTLCHELLHLWQHYHGTPSKSKYHNVEFRNKAIQCGLIVDPWGCTCGHTQVFSTVLARHGVHLEPLAAEMKLYGAGKNELKMKKWTCQCTTVRCATSLTALCLDCGQLFIRA